MMSYTVIGDTVNLASRLESANRIYGTRSLIPAATYEQARGLIEAREIDRVIVAGQSRSVAVYEMMARSGGLTATQARLRACYEEGLDAYRRRQWDESERALRAALEVAPGDGPARVLLARVGRFRQAGPDAEWNGSSRLDSK